MPRSGIGSYPDEGGRGGTSNWEENPRQGALSRGLPLIARGMGVVLEGAFLPEGEPKEAAQDK